MKCPIRFVVREQHIMSTIKDPGVALTTRGVTDPMKEESMFNSSTQNRAAYHLYLKSWEWRVKRQNWIDSGKPLMCWACEKPMSYFDWSGFNFHHRTYKNIFNEKLDDLVLLCEYDHRKLSEDWEELRHEIEGHCLHNQTHIYITLRRAELGLSTSPNNLVMKHLGEYHE